MHDRFAITSTRDHTTKITGAGTALNAGFMSMFLIAHFRLKRMGDDIEMVKERLSLGKFD